LRHGTTRSKLVLGLAFLLWPAGGCDNGGYHSVSFTKQEKDRLGAEFEKKGPVVRAKRGRLPVTPRPPAPSRLY
jgi:hypothetical protein